ncbi:cAMP-responsive element modulator isoform X27 [Eulemur rufifrons]|uniref:cAMP-responsive element modulator isoform X27 n=1 Tax=Eulemur rufifrons TaxID=859984 RepID=UPI003742C389
MTMETIESQQDGSVRDSVAESESAHMQTQTGQNSIPTLAQQQLQRQMSLQNQKV